MNMNRNICNVSFPKYCPFCLFIYLFVWQGEHFLQLPWTTACCVGGFICWEGHVLWRRLSLSFSSSFDTHLDTPVLTAFLWSMHPSQSINSFCNFIRISLSSTSTNFTPPPPHHPLSEQKPFISMRSKHECLKIVFTVQYVEIHRGSVTWWHPRDSGILRKPGQKHPPTSPKPDRSLCQWHKSNKSNLCSKLLNVTYNYYFRKWIETIFILLDKASS